LLVLDNCEHLAAGCALLAHTLRRACPQLRILATSREPLRAEGETVWGLPPLAVPRRRRTWAVAELAPTEAVALFTERARAARPDFALSAQNAMAVAAICHQRDGMPLALELA